MKIVTIGGGTGQFALLSALKNINNIDLTAIVSMVDSGGSTGRLRDEFGVLPPGDILKCLIALSPLTDARQILRTRFNAHEKLKNHNAGNLLLTFLSQYLAGDFAAAIEALSEILKIKGTVFPVTVNKATLAAELEDGDFIYSESAIDLPEMTRTKKIKRVFLVPHNGELNVYPKAAQAILDADQIFIGPGDLYTSIIPNFLVKGVVAAIKQTPARITYILNIMTKFSETQGYKASDFIGKLENYLGRKVDCVIGNQTIPEQTILDSYKQEKSEPVEIDIDDRWDGRKAIIADLIGEGNLARHDIGKLRQAIEKIISKKNENIS
jgi:uncharacterized cofD-like protein